jgi:hypothetical protein
VAISMQGNWTVRVKSKNAVYGQRFLVAGGTSADGVYPGNPGSAAVFVAGSQWSITVQSQPLGGDWRDSKQRISFPTVAAGLLTFDISSDDDLSDKDFDDLVLTCSMPISSSEFVVYGHAKTYQGPCLFNPCYPWYWLLDSPSALQRALETPGLASILSKLYPERTRPPRPGPGPDPGPFMPLLLPTGLTGTAAGVEFRSNSSDVARPSDADTSGAKARKAPSADQIEAESVARLEARAVRVRSEASPMAAGVTRLSDTEISVAATLGDRYRIPLACDNEAAPGLWLRFQEYDRTAAEDAGGPYTGGGSRENLGFAVTDEVGNYLFRFSRSLADFVAESSDIAVGESPGDAIRPDLIGQVLGTGAVVEYETAPYFDVPNLRRIDFCVPRDLVHPTVGCAGAGGFQRVGDILVVDASLGGHPNTLDDGRVTARNANAPQVDCAAWRGRLRIYGCLGANVARYTIRYWRVGIDTDWQFVQETSLLNYVPDFAPNYAGTPVGPEFVGVRVDGGGVVTRPTYTNHDGDTNWIENDLKVILSSDLYRPFDSPGPVDFWIQGYDTAGKLVAGSDDHLRLFVHNRALYPGRPQNQKGDIASIAMGATALGDCGLFDLTGPAAPLTVRYRAVDPDGFLFSWGLSVIRGNNNPVAVHRTAGVDMAKSYAAAPTPCVFRGTRDEPSADADDYVLTTLTPDTDANGRVAWLPAGVNFCAFGFRVTANDRVTDGRAGGTYPQVVFWEDLIGLTYTAPPPP